MNAKRGDISQLRQQRVLLDTSLWIYHFEREPRFGSTAQRILALLEAGGFAGIASELSLLELLVKPLQLRRVDVADEYELLLTSFPNLQLAPISRAILLQAAEIRAYTGLRTPDSILLATALDCGATVAVTNDDAWRRFTGCEIVLLSELA